MTSYGSSIKLKAQDCCPQENIIHNHSLPVYDKFLLSQHLIIEVSFSTRRLQSDADVLEASPLKIV